MEGGDGGIQDPSDAANGGGRNRTPEQGWQNLADPAGGQAGHEAGKNAPVDLRSAQLPGTAVGRWRRVRGTSGSMSPGSQGRLRR